MIIEPINSFKMKNQKKKNLGRMKKKQALLIVVIVALDEKWSGPYKVFGFHFLGISKEIFFGQTKTKTKNKNSTYPKNWFFSTYFSLSLILPFVHKV